MSVKPQSGGGRTARRLRRWIVAALAAAITPAFVGLPAGAASTPPQITRVAGYTGTATVTLGHPKPVSTAHLSSGYVAYDPANGDEALADVTAAGTSALVYLIAGETEPNEYHIETAPGVYGSLVKGDAYLVAGHGPEGMVANPGGPTPHTGGSPSPTAVANPIAPLAIAFDPSGNLLMSGNFDTAGNFESAVQMVAKATCASSCAYRLASMTAGYLYTVAGAGSLRGITQTTAVFFTIQVAGNGISVDAQGNLIVGAAKNVMFVNEQTTSVVRYGQTIPSFTAASIAGTETHGSATCGKGAKSVPAAGKSSVKFSIPHPYVDADGNVYINDDRTTANLGCTWVLPAVSGTLDNQTVTAGNLYALTGAATTTAPTDGAVANAVSFPHTNAVAVDGAGNIVLATVGPTPSMWAIAESTGTYYDQAMKKGDAYLLAGGATASRKTTGDATGFEFTGAAIPSIPPYFGITSLVNGAPGDLLLTNGSSRTTGTAYVITQVPTRPTSGEPQITSVTPTHGFLAGGIPVTIHGSNLTGVTKVLFGTATASTVVVTSPSVVTAVDPPHGAGSVSVTVKSLSGTFTLTGSFTYVTPKPVVTSVSPDSGTTEGGEAITISGTHFTGATAVHFGSSAGSTIVVTNPNQLTVTDPKHTAGPVTVSVTTPGGTATSPSPFTYVAAAPPDPPTGVTATRDGSGTGAIAWKTAPTNGSPVTQYRATAEPGGETCQASGLGCTIAGLVNGKTYALTVRATSAAGTSTPSSAVTFVPATLPGAPGTPTAVRGVAQAVVRWTAPTPTPGGIAITKYTVTSTPTDKTCTWTGKGTFVCTVTGLTNGTSYTFKAKATNAVGSGPTSVASNTATPEPTAPGSPTNVKVTAGNTQVTVTWTAPVSTGGDPITGYTVTATPGGKTCTTTGALTCAVTGLINTDEYYFSVSATNAVGTSPTSQQSQGVAPSATATNSGNGSGASATEGYWEVAADGGVFSFGNAQSYGSEGGKPLNAAIVDLAATPTGKGYWEVGSDGGLFAFGAAQFYGSMGGKPLNAPIVGIAITPTGKGYWEVASDGGLFAFGAAQFYGSMGGKTLNAAIVGMAVTPTGDGYWEVGSDGGLFAFGAAQFYGSMGGKTLDAPIVAVTLATTGNGYWEVASDGGLFAFGSAQFYGSEGGKPLAQPIVGMAVAPTGHGYWEAAADGGLFAFGSAIYEGSMGGKPLNEPVVGIAAVPGPGGSG